MMSGLWTSRATGGFVLCVALLTAQQNVQAADQPVLTELREVCELSHKDASQSLSLRVKGTVTFIEPDWNLMFIQAGDHWAYVEMQTKATPEVGQLVEVSGHTWPGESRASIIMTRLRVLGPGSLPEPVHVKPGTDRRAIQHRWIEVNGVVTLAEPGEKWCELHVASPEGVWFADVAAVPSLPPMTTLKGRRVCLRGVLFSTKSNPRDLRRLLVPGPGIVDVGVAEDDAEFGERRQIASLTWYDLTSGKRTKVRLLGLITFRDRDNRLFISDQTGCCLVIPKDQTDVAAGDVVEIRGVIVHDQPDPCIVDADVQHVSTDKIPKPAKVTAQEASKHLAAMIEVEGTTVSGGSVKSRPSLLLKDGDTVFRTWLGEDDDPSLLDLRSGARVLVSGACWTASDPHVDFEIFADSTMVLSPAPPPPESVDAFSFPFCLVVVSLAVIVAMTMVVLWIVRRGMRKQERYYESVNEQLNELSHVARLNTLAEMVGALAHELNQPLTSVLNYAAVANNLNPNDGEQSARFCEALARITEEAQRAGEIIRRLRNMVRKKTPGKVTTDINHLVEDTVSLFRTQAVTAASLVDLRLAEELPAVTADPIQIQQVILNLLLNAREATEHISGRAPKITVTSESTDEGVRLIVEDNGDGISASDPNAIFEAFYTTKDEGTGLGLAICRKIIEMHSGTITAHRLTPHGTRIRFTLPGAK